jgi:hypothetical protein
LQGLKNSKDALTSVKREEIMDEQNTVETTAAAEETTAVEKEQATPTAKTFTQDELNAIIDKRLERERKDAQARIDKAVTEAQKLAKMSADERAEHERQELQKTLARREAEITKRELRAEAKSQLSDKGLPVELAEVLPYTDADTTNAALAAVEKVFRQAVEKGVNERLKGNAPKVGQPAQGTTIAEPEKLSYAQRAELYQKDPSQYKKLFGGE